MNNPTFDNTSHGFDSFELKLGDELRGERATLGKSLLDVQRELRVKAAYISAIENCDISVFPNPSFVAGYVRSYARYLKLEPDATFARFCQEARFQGSGAELGGVQKKTPQGKTDLRPITDPHAWVPSLPGGGFDGRNNSNVGATLAAAGPVLALAVVIASLSYGVWFVLQDIQRVEFAPIEDNPMVAFEPEGLGATRLNGADGFLASGIEVAADPSILYNRRELDIPVVQPRDGPIAAIDPDILAPTLGIVDAASDELVMAIVETAPIVSETPHVPSISIIAQQEAWVRVYQENGTIIFEKTLAAGEQYALPSDAPAAYLRAGNATAVFVMVDDAAYGPISTTQAVVRDIALLPTEIASAMGSVENPSVALQVAADAWRKMHTARMSD